jgi:hypothetical protein
MTGKEGRPCSFAKGESASGGWKLSVQKEHRIHNEGK